MEILNRRNAMLGWAVWTLAKGAAKRKAKRALPSVDADSKRPNRTVLVLGLAGAAAAGTAYLWWRQTGGEGPDTFA